LNTRTQFTIRIAKLIFWVESKGWFPILDYVLRSKEEQRRLFNLDLSKCDGEKKKSKHQTGHAADLYIHDGDKNIQKKALYKEAHEFWETLGGKPMIEWDQAHFED
jgi:hypothetical protein